MQYFSTAAPSAHRLTKRSSPRPPQETEVVPAQLENAESLEGMSGKLPLEPDVNQLLPEISPAEADFRTFLSTLSCVRTEKMLAFLRNVRYN